MVKIMVIISPKVVRKSPITDSGPSGVLVFEVAASMATIPDQNISINIITEK